MKLFLISVMAVFCFYSVFGVNISATSSAAGVPAAAGLLNEIDSNLFIGDNFAMDLDITYMVSNQTINTYNLTVYIRMKGREKPDSLAYFNSPLNVRGRKMLMSGNNIWMQFPNTRNAIRLTPLEILLGGASEGDAARVGFGFNYIPEIISFDPENNICKMVLTVREDSRGSTYGKIVSVIDISNKSFISGDFYSESGKLLKTVTYHDYQSINGKNFPTLLIITDAIDNNKVTKMKYNKVVLKALPRSYFRMDYLSSFIEEPIN